MTSSEKFSNTLSESARSGTFDRDLLVAQACDLTRELRAKGTTPEGTLISVKNILEDVFGPSDRLKEDIVTNCIETFFES